MQQLGSDWAARALVAPFSRYLALWVILASLVHPVEGLSVDLCLFHATTSWPCPGCGLSRAFSAMSRGEWQVAVGAHPFIVIFWPLFLLLAVLALLPERWSRRVEAWVLSRAAGTSVPYGLLLHAFVGFGVLRLAVFAVFRLTFP